MKKILLIFGISLIANSTFSQSIIAKTETGQYVVLKENKTWEFVEDVFKNHKTENKEIKNAVNLLSKKLEYKNNIKGNLSGRILLNKTLGKIDCEEEGTVVVSISVNRKGEVIRAIPGARGTTNSAPCLFKVVKKSALATKWNEDKNAPSQQRGTMIYKIGL